MRRSRCQNSNVFDTILTWNTVWRIPDACRYMRIIEEWGSGIPRIQRMLAEAGLKLLEIIDNGINLQFRIWRPAASGDGGMKGGMKGGTETPNQENGAANVMTTTEKTTREKIREKTTEKTPKEKATTEKTTEKTMGNTATNILRIVRDFPSISMKDLAIKCGITEDGVYWNIKQLKALGRIHRIGPDKGGHWEVVS